MDMQLLISSSQLQSTLNYKSSLFRRNDSTIFPDTYERNGSFMGLPPSATAFGQLLRATHPLYTIRSYARPPPTHQCARGYPRPIEEYTYYLGGPDARLEGSGRGTLEQSPRVSAAVETAVNTLRTFAVVGLTEDLDAFAYLVAHGTPRPLCTNCSHRPSELCRTPRLRQPFCSQVSRAPVRTTPLAVKASSTLLTAFYVV